MIETSAVLDETFKYLIKISNAFLPLFILGTLLPILLRIARVMFEVNDIQYEEKEIKNTEKIFNEYHSKEFGQNKFYFYATYMKKQGFLISLFTRFSESTIKIGKHIYKKDAEKYSFSTSHENKIKIENKIHKPIKDIKDYSILIQFHDDIHYALSHLSKFCEMQDAINLSDEIDKVGNLIAEIKKYSDEIENAANMKVERLRNNTIESILDKHHLIMDQLTLKAKIYNANSPEKVDLTKSQNETIKKEVTLK